MKQILTLIGLLFCIMPLKAQQYEGTVTNTGGKPIARASVVVTDSLHNALSFTRSDAKGAFALKSPSGKKVAYITFTAVGYAKKEFPIEEFTNGSSIRMDEKAIELKEVVVKDEPVKRSGDTVSYRVSAFKQAYDRSIEDVIAKMPGLKVDDKGIIYYNNQAIRNFYIEDMDMMGNQYVQASRNLSADRVESVQVYEHHEEVKALQGISKSNAVALNIKLKKNAKNIWTGSGDMTLGLPVGDADRLLREWRLSPMMFAKNLQTLSLYKSNNIGTDLQPEVGNTGGMRTFNPIRNIQYGTSFTDRKRSLFNDSHLLTTNWLYKPQRDTDLRLQLSGLLDHETGELTRETHYTDMNDNIVRTERNTSDCYHQEWNANLKFQQNKARYMLSNETAAHLDLSHSTGVAYLNGNRTDQRVRPHEIRLDNSLRAIRRINQRHSVTFSSDLSYSRLPASLRLYNNREQETRLNNLRWENKVSFMHSWRRFSLSATAEGGLLFQDFHVASPDTIARNLYREAYALLRPSLDYELGAWHFSLVPRVRLLNQSIEHRRQLRWLVEPEASIRYDNRGLFSHLLHYLTINTLSDLLRITDIPFYQNYAFSSAGTGMLRLSRFETLGLTSNFRDVGHRLYGGISLGYTANTTHSMFSNAMDAEGVYNRNSYDRKNRMENYNASFNIQKNLSWAQTSIRIDGSYGMSRYPMVIGGEETVSRMYNTTLKASVIMRPIQPFTLDVGAERIGRHSSKMWSGGQAVTTANYYGHLNLHYVQDRWLVSLTNWCSLTDEDGQNNVLFSDAKLTYKLKRFDVILSCNNLWNKDRIVRRGITVYEETFSIYRLRPREVMIGFSLLL